MRVVVELQVLLNEIVWRCVTKVMTEEAAGDQLQGNW